MLDSPTRSIAAELTIVVPTFRERDNVRPLVERLEAALAGFAFEIVFVDDDSPDGTADEVANLANANPRVRLIRRIGRRGLSSACVEGILSSTAPYVAVIDADLQHDESILPAMLERIRTEPLDVVIGTRYTGGGTASGGFSRRRQLLSELAGSISRRIMRADVSDPMSGFFLIRRDAFDAAVHNLSQLGFKILLDLFLSSPRPLRHAEMPYAFKQRLHGESKLDTMVAWDFMMLLLDKTIGRYLPVRFVMFMAVGGTGLVVHLTILYFALMGGLGFASAQAVAVMISIVWNFIVNNRITYRDRRLKGWAFATGLGTFFAVCSVGALANVGVASMIYEADGIWWLAGLAGAIVGAVWNFAASNYVTWRRR